VWHAALNDTLIMCSYGEMAEDYGSGTPVSCEGCGGIPDIRRKHSFVKLTRVSTRKEWLKESQAFHSEGTKPTDSLSRVSDVTRGNSMCLPVCQTLVLDTPESCQGAIADFHASNAL
jgi:hypothetical protein